MSESELEFELQCLREEAMKDVVRAVTEWCKHRKAFGVGQRTEEQLVVECALDRKLCEAARALIARDDAYCNLIDAKSVPGNDTVN